MVVHGRNDNRFVASCQQRMVSLVIYIHRSPLWYNRVTNTTKKGQAAHVGSHATVFHPFQSNAAAVSTGCLV
jgi:hypothetical protein